MLAGAFRNGQVRGARDHPAGHVSTRGVDVTALHVLRSGLIRLEISPELGGSITRLDLTVGSTPVEVLRGCNRADVEKGDARAAAMFPMVPFANRAPENRITAIDPPVELEPNVAGQPLAIHGIGWQRSWQASKANQQSLRLVLDVAEDSYVFPFRVVQQFEVNNG